MIAEKATVYEKFPTPLINRLEKHFVLVSSILTDKEAHMVKELQRWIHKFSTVNSRYSESWLLYTFSFPFCFFIS